MRLPAAKAGSLGNPGLVASSIITRASADTGRRRQMLNVRKRRADAASRIVEFVARRRRPTLNIRMVASPSQLMFDLPDLDARSSRYRDITVQAKTTARALRPSGVPLTASLPRLGAGLSPSRALKGRSRFDKDRKRDRRCVLPAMAARRASAKPRRSWLRGLDMLNAARRRKLTGSI